MLNNPLINWWLLSERKYSTFQALYENNCLSYEQVLRLKQAQACYEVVPSVIMTPFVYQFLKLAVLMPRRMTQVRFGKASATALLSYVAAIGGRDATYWPIVAQIYSEVYHINI